LKKVYKGLFREVISDDINADPILVIDEAKGLEKRRGF
jgi:hypothetical protein